MDCIFTAGPGAHLSILATNPHKILSTNPLASVPRFMRQSWIDKFRSRGYFVLKFIVIMCSPSVHHLFTICSPCVHCVFTMYSSCIHHVFIMCLSCVHYVFTMCLPCIHHVFAMCSPCVHHEGPRKAPFITWEKSEMPLDWRPNDSACQKDLL